MEQWFSKSVILKDFDIYKDVHLPVPKDMTITYRPSDNHENYAILQGGKQHINQYLSLLDDAHKLLGERHRKLSNLPKYHIYNSKVERVQ